MFIPAGVSQKNLFCRHSRLQAKLAQALKSLALKENMSHLDFNPAKLEKSSVNAVRQSVQSVMKIGTSLTSVKLVKLDGTVLDQQLEVLS